MGNRMELLQQLVEQYYHLTDRQLDFFLKEQIVLGNYCTSKTHLKLKKDYKPKDKSVTISELDDLIF